MENLSFVTEFVDMFRTLLSNRICWIYDINKKLYYTSDTDCLLNFDLLIDKLNPNQIYYPADIIINHDNETTISHDDMVAKISAIVEIIPLTCGNNIIAYCISYCNNIFNWHKITQHILSNSQATTTTTPPALTRRQNEIIHLTLKGLKYYEIANLLARQYGHSITESTIGNTMRNFIFKKFNVYNVYTLKKKLLNHQLYNYSLLKRELN